VDKPQDESRASMCRKFIKEDGLINPFVDSIELIRNKYRAFALWPKLYWIYEDKRIIIESLLRDQTSYENNKYSPLIDRHGQINPSIISGTIKPESGKSQDLHQRWATQKKSS
jgi:methionyl-tRNA formyltransferase